MSLRTIAMFLLVALTTSLFAQKNTIIFIGDGFGVAPKTAARLALGQGQDGKRFSDDPDFQLLAMDKLKYTTMVTTHSLNSWITDSAPGASVYACGKAGKVDNEAIAFDLESAQPIESILEAAKKEGYAVGLVTTTRITHATPASFASHIWNRDLEDYIALQYFTTSQQEYEDVINSGGVVTYDADRDWHLPVPKQGVELDVVLGGGARFFFPDGDAGGPGPNTIVRDANGDAVMFQGDTVKLGSGRRTDGVDLVEYAKTKGYVYVNSREALNAVDLAQFDETNDAKLFGLFHNSHTSYEQDRQIDRPWEPSLKEMTEMAIEVLKRKSDKGFFLMVESGRIDHLEHANSGGVFPVDGEYVIEADKEAIPDDGIYGGSTTRADGYYGSDYMIKEVIDFDNSIEEGRKLFGQGGQTLVMVTADHECGGFAIVGLHDQADAQGNGTLIRTYAKQPEKTNGEFTPVPVTISRGDAEIGGWFPEYNMVDFQGTLYPEAPITGRRIVISYGSNPATNGNGGAVFSTPGNHTPADIWVGADDNAGGQYAGKLTGRGLLDNTDLYPVMMEFLDLDVTGTEGELGTLPGSFELHNNYPNPFNPTTTISFDIPQAADVNVTIYNSLGQKVRELISGNYTAGSHQVQWDGKNDFGSSLASGMYVYSVKVADKIASKKMMLLK